MKNKIFILSALIVAALAATACNEEWKDEQYEHYVSFRAPLPLPGKYGTGTGTTPIYVPYTRMKNGAPERGAGKSSYRLPMIVSGSTTNDRDITVHVAHDPDTLAYLNKARFSTRTDLYYSDMGESRLPYVSYSETAGIEAGQRVGLFDIDFDFNGIDMSDKWVLPLQVLNDPSYGYVANPRKNYSKALLRVFPFNDFSGDYSGTMLNMKPIDDSGTETDGSITKNMIRGYVVDDNTIFIYAGVVDENYTDRKKYKILMKFTGEENGSVELNCPNAEEIGFVATPGVTASFRRQSSMDATRPYLEHRYVIVNNVDYYFNYILSDNGAGEKTFVRYHVKGTLTLGRDINTQIPDEDQAIEW